MRLETLYCFFPEGFEPDKARSTITDHASAGNKTSLR